MTFLAFKFEERTFQMAWEPLVNQSSETHKQTRKKPQNKPLTTCCWHTEVYPVLVVFLQLLWFCFVQNCAANSIRSFVQPI